MFGGGGEIYSCRRRQNIFGRGWEIYLEGEGKYIPLYRDSKVEQQHWGRTCRQQSVTLPIAQSESHSKLKI